MKTLSTTLLLLAVLGAGCASTEEAADNTSPQAPPDMEAMMAAMMEAGTPKAPHRLLDPFVGTWNAVVKMYMDPSMPPEESIGRMATSWILNGRYLEQRYEGDFGGQPFSGLSIWGYDNAAGKYVGTWIDSMSTTIAWNEGTVSADGKTFTLSMTATDPMTGLASKGEEVLTIDSPNQNTMTMYELRDGARIKNMEIVYKRAR